MAVVVIIVVVVVAVAVTLSKKNNNAYPDYSVLNYSLQDTCESAHSVIECEKMGTNKYRWW